MKYLKLYEQFRLLLEADEKKDNTILYNLSQGGEKTLILLPGSGKDGGQGKDDFQLLADTLGKDFSVYSADFENAFDVRAYAKKIANEINNNDDIKQCAVGGFSIGGGMAWHLAMALKTMGSKKFNNQLFFIDSGIANSTKEFAENIVTKSNTPRVAMATRMKLIKKVRSGGEFTPEEDESVKHIYSQKELDDFKLKNKGKYIEYVDEDFPPDNDAELDLAAKAIDENNPDEVYIIEDKYDKTKFDVRYSVKPIEIKEMSFKDGDVFNLRKFVENDTLKKKGLGRETESGEMLPPLNGVEVISLVAGGNEGKAKSPEDIKECEKEAIGSTTGDSKVIVISGTEHKNITKSPNLATKISSSFK
jgi:hypothetical protein